MPTETTRGYSVTVNGHAYDSELLKIATLASMGEASLDECANALKLAAFRVGRYRQLHSQAVDTIENMRANANTNAQND